MVFGFCISDCSGTGSNANGSQASAIMTDLASTHPCNGGAFFWVAEHDSGGSWSASVGNTISDISKGCSSPTTPRPTPDGISPQERPAPTTPRPTPDGSSPQEAPAMCGGGAFGNGVCADP